MIRKVDRQWYKYLSGQLLRQMVRFRSPGTTVPKEGNVFTSVCHVCPQGGLFCEGVCLLRDSLPSANAYPTNGMYPVDASPIRCLSPLVECPLAWNIGVKPHPIGDRSVDKGGRYASYQNAYMLTDDSDTNTTDTGKKSQDQNNHY